MINLTKEQQHKLERLGNAEYALFNLHDFIDGALQSCAESADAEIQEKSAELSELIEEHEIEEMVGQILTMVQQKISFLKAFSVREQMNNLDKVLDDAMASKEK